MNGDDKSGGGFGGGGVWVHVGYGMLTGRAADAFTSV